MKSIADNSVIVCDKVISITDSVSVNVTNTVTTNATSIVQKNSGNKKVRCKK